MPVKKLFTKTLTAFCCLCCFHAAAQFKPPAYKTRTAKAYLFTALPDTINTAVLTIEKLFDVPVGATVSIPAGPDLFFTGTVTEKIEKSTGITSINIRCSNYDSALITLSKITEKNRIVDYAGRIIHVGYGDMYLLTKQNGRYGFAKRAQSMILVE